MIKLKDTKNTNPYVMIIHFSRVISSPDDMATEFPVESLNLVEIICQQLEGTKISDFLKVFPLRKRYANDEIWDYHSSKAKIDEMGSVFDKENVKKIIMMDCFENEAPSDLGIMFMMSVNQLNKRRKGIGIFEEFMYKEALEKEKFKVSVKNKTHIKRIK